MSSLPLLLSGYGRMAGRATEPSWALSQGNADACAHRTGSVTRGARTSASPGLGEGEIARYGDEDGSACHVLDRILTVRSAPFWMGCNGFLNPLVPVIF
jgi:hypothetical protein